MDAADSTCDILSLLQLHRGSSECTPNSCHHAFAVREDAAAKEDERAELWQADWDDEETTEDFQAKLRHELDRHMKD